MDERKISWKSEWKAAGLDPGALSSDEEALVPQLIAENERFLAQHPYRSSPKKLSFPRVVNWSVPLVAAAALVFFLGLPPSQDDTSAQGMERMKGAGDSTLLAYRQAKAGAEPLSGGAVVRPGDVLQLAYRVPVESQGAVLSLDGNGKITVHLAKGNRSLALQPGSERRLDFSYELDGAPRFEVFFLLVSPRPFELDTIGSVLKAKPWKDLKADAFGSDIRFVTLPLMKGSQ